MLLVPYMWASMTFLPRSRIRFVATRIQKAVKKYKIQKDSGVE